MFIIEYINRQWSSTIMLFPTFIYVNTGNVEFILTSIKHKRRRLDSTKDRPKLKLLSLLPLRSWDPLSPLPLVNILVRSDTDVVSLSLNSLEQRCALNGPALSESVSTRDVPTPPLNLSRWTLIDLTATKLNSSSSPARKESQRRAM